MQFNIIEEDYNKVKLFLKQEYVKFCLFFAFMWKESTVFDGGDTFTPAQACCDPLPTNMFTLTTRSRRSISQIHMQTELKCVQN